jgi:hypothetical protein
MEFDELAGGVCADLVQERFYEGIGSQGGYERYQAGCDSTRVRLVIRASQ